ncbi:MAG: carboxypeptidase-like regulatory domain-containing protein, partial [Bacteroidales bacterium]|nr:carboxypeptidase-like regulatory domain-containing protein [Bacteroidales bacterium]
NYFEFVSDKYVSVYYTHHFDGYFFNRVPLLRHLKWREVVFAKGLIGGLDEANREYSVFPQGMHTLDKPYFEAGAGIENIFKIIRVDAIWRLSYLDHPNISKFGVRFSLQFAF